MAATTAEGASRLSAGPAERFKAVNCIGSEQNHRAIRGTKVARLIEFGSSARP
jgi:hypothetical protein